MHDKMSNVFEQFFYIWITKRGNECDHKKTPHNYVQVVIDWYQMK